MTTAARSETKLVEASFRRPLSTKERARLEDVLAGSAELSERYRRLQLAERVVAHGPEGALEQPSPMEVDRMAAGLGLLEPAPPVSVWRRFAAPWIFGAALAVSAGIAVFTVVPPPTQDVLQPRGELATGASFSFYLVSPEGGFEGAREGAAVSAAHRLKLRLSWADAPGALDAVWVAAVDEAGRVQTTRLEAPEGSIAAVPGVVSLWGLEPGRVAVYVIASPAPLDATAVKDAAQARPEAAALASALGAAGVDRLELSLEAEGAGAR